MENKEVAVSGKKKTYGRWEKSTTVNGKTTRISVQEVENGYIKTVSIEDENGWDEKKYISKENPMEEKSLIEKLEALLND
jgi:hypothetical protein